MSVLACRPRRARYGVERGELRLVRAAVIAAALCAAAAAGVCSARGRVSADPSFTAADGR